VINAIHVDESHLQKPQQTFASLVKRDIAMGGGSGRSSQG
jgi:hypothetical protein